MDQPAANVKAEAEEPQDQNDYKDCPKHIFLFSKPGRPEARLPGAPTMRLQMTIQFEATA